MAILPLVITDSQHINNIISLLSDIADENDLFITVIERYSDIEVSIYRDNKITPITGQRSRFETSAASKTDTAVFSTLISKYKDPVWNYDNSLFLSKENYDIGMNNYRKHITDTIKERIG